MLPLPWKRPKRCKDIRNTFSNAPKTLRVILKALTDMRLDNNPLRSPPIELLPQVGGRSAAAVG